MGEVTENVRISYSSSQTFQGCNRKFYYEKIRKFDHDPDCDPDTKALRLGKAFHEVLEFCHHHKSLLKLEHFQKAFKNNGIDTPTEQGYIHAMVRKYLKLHLMSNLGIKAIEMKVGNSVDYLGFIDAVMGDSRGNWWIVDLKTAGRLSEALLSRLSLDPQLNIYSYFKAAIAKEKGLDVDKFRGVRYRVTTKPQIKCGAKEKLKDFVQRCMERIESYDISIPANELNPEFAYNRLMGLLDEARALQEMDEKDISQNYGYCESYFKPCPYWSRCYGHTFTAAAERHILYDSTNCPDMTKQEHENVQETDDLDFL